MTGYPLNFLWALLTNLGGEVKKKKKIPVRGDKALLLS